jgi:hypothetical protein
MVGLLFGLSFCVIVFISGYLKMLLLLISRGLIGSRIPFMYLIIPISALNNSIFSLTFMNFVGLIPGLILIFLLMKQGFKIQQETGLDNTVATCGSFMIIGSLIGIIIKLLISLF